MAVSTKKLILMQKYFSLSLSLQPLSFSLTLSFSFRLLQIHEFHLKCISEEIIMLFEHISCYKKLGVKKNQGWGKNELVHFYPLRHTLCGVKMNQSFIFTPIQLLFPPKLNMKLSSIYIEISHKDLFRSALSLNNLEP